jgi:hypothetical protein
MATLEMVEKLRERANVTFDEAKAALDQTGDDILEALILLERMGKVAPPEGGGVYSSDASEDDGADRDAGGRRAGRRRRHGRNGGGDRRCDEDAADSGSQYGARFSDVCRNIGRVLGKLLHIGNTTTFEISRQDKHIIGVPLTVLALALIFFFKISLIVLVVGLFFGFRYRIAGERLGGSPVNSVMDSAAEAAEALKNSLKN